MTETTSVTVGVASYRKARYGVGKTRHEAFLVDATGVEVVLESSIHEKVAREAVRKHNRARKQILAGELVVGPVMRHVHPFVPAPNAQSLKQADYDAIRKSLRAPSRRSKCLGCAKVRVLVDGARCSRCNPTHRPRH